MKPNFFTRLVLPVHDLVCALGELERAAVRFSPLKLPSDPSTMALTNITRANLARAAVAFTIQLAIEVGQDPAQMRALERELIAKVTGEPERTP